MKLGTIGPDLMATTSKPFLKWAGAKTSLVKTLREFLPPGEERRYIEPFVGSGVVFLNMPYRSSLLSDSNHDLVSLYSVLKSKRGDFIQRCQRLFTPENN